MINLKCNIHLLKMFRVNIIAVLILFRFVLGILQSSEELYEKCSESESYCIPTSSCRSYKNESDQIKQCGGNGTHLMICCPKVPIKRDCGVPATSDKVVGGVPTSIDEFPWMVVLEYRDSDTEVTRVRCGGSLINQRYILTAAHCLIDDNGWKLWRIRLGEYHLTNSTDYVENITANAIVKITADPIVNITFERIIIHPRFNRYSFLNDIGLIRLSNDVEYSDFIQPICLPSTLRMNLSSENTYLVISGWGATSTADLSPTKQKLEVPVNNFAKCIQRFDSPNRRLNETTQICAGGRDGEDACSGDSGGPIMRKFQHRYVIEGVTSFGRECGIKYWPAVYTRLSSFESWIFENILP